MDFLTNSALIEAIDRLYFNPRSGKLKPGSTNWEKPGNVRRLQVVLGQLEFNYDLSGMKADQILGLLPPEFDEWKPRGPQMPLVANAATSSSR